MTLTTNFKLETVEHKKANYRPNSLPKLAYFRLLSRTSKIKKKGSKILYIHKLVRFIELNEFISEAPKFLRDMYVRNKYKFV
jgi:hypothetical protein